MTGAKSAQSRPYWIRYIVAFWSWEKLKWAKDNVLIACVCSLAPGPDCRWYWCHPQRPQVARSGVCNSCDLRRSVCLIPHLEAGCHALGAQIARGNDSSMD